MSLDSDIQLLATVRLFEGFRPEHLRLLAFGAEARMLARGTRLYRKDVPSDGGYVIVRGVVELTSGDHDQDVQRYGEGALIGELALITDTMTPATAIAVEHTEVLKLPRTLFRRMLEEYPELAELLFDRLAHTTEEFVGRLDIVRAKLDHATDLQQRRERDRG
ncbi:MAG: cyclic nucleotide-binding domain-containing protein [Pseudomonadota bacterium]